MATSVSEMARRAQRLICWPCRWWRYAKKLKEHAMRTSHKTPETITTIGIDLGKNTFHLVGLDKRGAIALQRKVSRTQLEHVFPMSSAA
jgi:hypothetical protein